MKQGRQNRKSLSLGPIERDVPETFFRLCHHCLFLNESEEEISRCLRCEKGFLPSEVELWEDEQYDDGEEDEHEAPLARKKHYLNGLNGKW